MGLLRHQLRDPYRRARALHVSEVRAAACLSAASFRGRCLSPPPKVESQLRMASSVLLPAARASIWNLAWKQSQRAMGGRSCSSTR